MLIGSVVRASEEAANHGVSHWWFGIFTFAALSALLVVTMMLKVEPKQPRRKRRAAA